MKNNLFDIFVREKMNGYKPDVPSHIWENIAANNGKKKPVAFWLSPFGKAAAIAILLSAAAAGGYYFSTQKTGAVINEFVKKEKQASIKNDIAYDNNITTTKPEPLPKVAIKTKKDKATPQHIIASKLPNTSIDETLFENNGNNIVTNGILKIKKVNATILEEDNFNDKIVLANTISQAELITKSYVLNELNVKKIKPFGFSIPCPTAEENAAGNKKYIELYAGPDYAFKSYEDTGTAYIEKRKASTALFYAFTAGVRYTKVFSTGISVKIGANYSQINERFFAKNGYELSRVFTINNVGDTTSNYYLSTPKYEKSTNVYRSFDIPVQMGYEMGNGKLHANISAGVNINITSSQKGNVIDQTGLAINIGADDAKATKYKNKTNTGVSFLGSASLYYKIKKKFHLLAEPYIRYGLSPNTKSELTLKQRTHTTGLRIGVRKDL